MSKGARRGPSFLPIDMGTNRIEGLGRSTLPDGAARLDDIPPFSTATPTHDGGAGSAGNSGTIADGAHQHPGENPAEASSYLYPSDVPTPGTGTLHAPAVYVPLTVSPYDDGIGNGLDFSRWTPIAGAFTWQYNYHNQLFKDQVGLGGSHTYEPMTYGQRFVVPNDFSQVNPAVSPNLGIYELVHQSDGSTDYAIIRRTADANTSAGLAVNTAALVTGDPTATGYGQYYVQQTAGPITVGVTALQFVAQSTYAPDVTHKLLTGAQLLSEGADITSTLYCDGYGTGDMDPVSFDSLAGTPGVSVMPAELYGAQLEGVTVRSSDPAATAVLSIQFIDLDGAGTSFLGGFSNPLPVSSTPTTVGFQAALASPYTWIPTGRLRILISMTATGSQPVTVAFAYSSPTRGTWLKLPFSMLTGLSTVPANNVTPGLLQTGLQSATTVAGIIPTITNNSIDVTVDAGLVVNGMSTVGLISGDILWLCFLNACHVIHGATVAAGQAPFHLGSQFDPNGINWNPTTGTKHTRGRITVKFYDSAYSGGPFFELVGGPNA